MPDNRIKMSLQYRLAFYAGGFVFAVGSYLLGVWVFALESANWGDLRLYQSLMKDIGFSLESHWPSLSGWILICEMLAALIGSLFAREVENRHAAEQRANIDGLTEIYNHRYFQERLDVEIERAGRYGRVVSLILFDLDYFKVFNDNWGHQVGDRVLKWFAQICKDSIRNIDILARYGGEEFALIMPETGSGEAQAAAERIRRVTEQASAQVFQKYRSITVSAGIATFTDHAEDKDSLICRADAALYSAKHNGRNQIQIYDEDCARLHHVSKDHIGALLASDDISALEALAAAVDERDKYTVGHSRAVMEISMAIGRCVGLSADELATLKSASLLHDLGKVGVTAHASDDKIRTASDQAHTEEHPNLGSKILRRIQQMNSVLPGVRHHHECFDGSGYPSRLAGANIPLPARIIAIADIYDTLTNDRPGRKALSNSQAMQQIVECSGSQFDPALVEAFVEMMKERGNTAA